MTEYRQMDGISQSLLKKLWTDPSYYKNPQESDASYFLFGSLVDTLLTESAEFNDKYSVAVATPSDTVKSIIERYVELSQDYKLINEEALINFAKHDNYESRMVDMVKYLAKLKNETTLTYARFLGESTNKTIIDSTLYLQAVDSVTAIKYDTYTKWIFDSDTYTIYDKVVVQFHIEDRLCKAEIDRVLVNKVTDEILPIDFKTTGKNIIAFPNEFWKYRHDVQAAWYRKALTKWAGDTLGISSPEIKDFYFAAVESTSNPKARVFVANERVMNNAITGFTNRYGIYMEGVDDLLERLDFHEIYGFDYPADYLKNGGAYIIE